MSPFPLADRLAALFVLLALVGCDSATGDAQRAFETQAFFGISDGPTADDWRVGPAVSVSLEVLRPIAPNPARRGDVASVQIASRTATPGGFALRVRNAAGGFDRGLLQTVSGANGPNIYTFSFFASEAATFAGRPTGSVRLVVLDSFERVVTYGDLVVTD